MVRKKVEDIVEEVGRPITDKLELELIDVEYKKEGNNYILRIIIDKPGGINIEDCENVSRSLDEKLDELDPIPHGYYLEVQSPGERVLKRDKEYDYFKGRDVEVKLYEALDGKKKFEGKLEGKNNDLLSISFENGETREFQIDKVSSVRLKVNI